MTAKYEPTQEERDKVKLLAIVGTRQDIIARLIKRPLAKKPMTDKTLRKHFTDELELGTAEANGMVANACFNMAISGLEPGMTAFWLKCRAGWRETAVIQNQQLDANGNPVNLKQTLFAISFADGGPGHEAQNTAPLAGEEDAVESSDQED